MVHAFVGGVRARCNSPRATRSFSRMPLCFTRGDPYGAAWRTASHAGEWPRCPRLIVPQPRCLACSPTGPLRFHRLPTPETNQPNALATQPDALDMPWSWTHAPEPAIFGAFKCPAQTRRTEPICYERCGRVAALGRARTIRGVRPRGVVVAGGDPVVRGDVVARAPGGRFGRVCRFKDGGTSSLSETRCTVSERWCKATTRPNPNR